MKDIICSATEDCISLYHGICGIDGYCGCLKGYSINKDYCIDIDECTILYPNSICDHNAICINQPGDYYCRCVDGYFGKGYKDQCYSIVTFSIVLVASVIMLLTLLVCLVLVILRKMRSENDKKDALFSEGGCLDKELWHHNDITPGDYEELKKNGSFRNVEKYKELIKNRTINAENLKLLMKSKHKHLIPYDSEYHSQYYWRDYASYDDEEDYLNYDSYDSLGTYTDSSGDQTVSSPVTEQTLDPAIPSSPIISQLDPAIAEQEPPILDDSMTAATEPKYPPSPDIVKDGGTVEELKEPFGIDLKPKDNTDDNYEFPKILIVEHIVCGCAGGSRDDIFGKEKIDEEETEFLKADIPKKMI